MNPFIAEILMFGGNYAPRGWAFCNGQLLSIAEYQALFSLLGTTYGGDGRSTFALPDLRGRAPLHAGQGPGLTPRAIGQRAGNENTTITPNNLPPHNHTASLHVSSANASVSVPTIGNSIATPGTSDGRSFSGTLGFNTTSPDTTMNAGSVTTGNTGNGQSFNNMQPFLAVNYIIALEGVYPSRS